MASSLSKKDFLQKFELIKSNIDYQFHPIYNPFYQIDGDWYKERQEDFYIKYKIFASITQILQPKHIIELGVCISSGAHAYLFGSPNSFYTGYDLFGNQKNNIREINTLEIAHDVLKNINAKYCLHKVDLRNLSILPEADFVAVDADHSFDSCYNDCVLAKTANPEYIFIDDVLSDFVRKASRKFIYENYKNIDWVAEIKYNCIGLLIKFNK